MSLQELGCGGGGGCSLHYWAVFFFLGSTMTHACIPLATVQLVLADLLGKRRHQSLSPHGSSAWGFSLYQGCILPVGRCSTNNWQVRKTEQDLVIWTWPYEACIPPRYSFSYCSCETDGCKDRCSMIWGCKWDGGDILFVVSLFTYMLLLWELSQIEDLKNPFIILFTLSYVYLPFHAQSSCFLFALISDVQKGLT